jgi:hypothetical protein
VDLPGRGYFSGPGHHFRYNAVCWAGALRHAGADVVMTERAGSHGSAFWKQEFPLMIDWAFGH